MTLGDALITNFEVLLYAYYNRILTLMKLIRRLWNIFDRCDKLKRKSYCFGEQYVQNYKFMNVKYVQNFTLHFLKKAKAVVFNRRKNIWKAFNSFTHFSCSTSSTISWPCQPLRRSERQAAGSNLSLTSVLLGYSRLATTSWGKVGGAWLRKRSANSRLRTAFDSRLNR